MVAATITNLKGQISDISIGHLGANTDSLLIVSISHYGRDSVSNHQPHECLLNRLFRRRSKKISKLRVTGLCAGNSPGIGEFPAQMASKAEKVSIWWRHHGTNTCAVWCSNLLWQNYMYINIYIYMIYNIHIQFTRHVWLLFFVIWRWLICFALGHHCFR